ncbi:hypothetical protein [Mycobacterium sp.]|uniref:hypothetical protein n=1 Tax=Mycobacterium sp. TaxID=1785 RepID=UPI002F40135D
MDTVNTISGRAKFTRFSQRSNARHHHALNFEIEDGYSPDVDDAVLRGRGFVLLSLPLGDGDQLICKPKTLRSGIYGRLAHGTLGRSSEHVNGDRH